MSHPIRNRTTRLFFPRVSVSSVVLGLILGLGLGAAAPSTVQGQTTYTVTNTTDSGAGSLRAAIDDANDGSGMPADVIEFDISGGGPHVIQLSSALPDITDPVVIDGTSEPDHPSTAALDAPVVEIDGQNSSGSGLTVDAPNVTIKGLALTNFDDGIGLNAGATDVLIGENYIGVAADGSAAGNAGEGISAKGDDGRIGDDGSNGTDGNVISNNGSHGIGFVSNDTEIIGNRIGTSPDGMSAMGNGANGIQIAFGSSITIGGLSADERNVISGNANQGIRSSGSSVTVTNNWIGVTADGTTDLGNGSDGVRLRNGASNSTVGGGNVISGNGGAGVRITDANDNGTTGNVVEGNRIGTNVSATAAVANDDGGVVIEEGAADNSIGGGTTNAEGNVISGNEVSGVSLLSGATDNTVQGNYVGTSVSGIVALSNAEGIVVASDGGGNTIGGSSAGAGNLVSGNDVGGIVFLDSGGPNTVQGNRIGVDENGDPLGNGAAGIEIGNTQNVTVGGTSSGAGNTIAHNANGIIVSSGSAGNAIRGNAIFANANQGIDLDEDGETANDAGDGDDGPNRLQNFPEVQSADYDAGANEVTVTYLVPSDPNASGSGASTYPLAVDFYETGASGQQGRAYLGTDTYSAGSPDDYAGCGSPPCTVTTTFTPQASVTEADVIVATATDANGNTSEFSATNQPLPVELASMEASRTGESTVELTWQTASETGNAGFRVQRRTRSDSSWSRVGFVESKAPGGTSTEALRYRFTAEDLTVGTHQFRLKQMDLDGSAQVHDPVTVELTMQETLRLGAPAPNPVQSQATVSFAVREEADATITLYNTLGQEVRTLYRGTPGAGDGQTVDVSTTGLSSGVYFLRLRADGRTETRRLTVVQ